MDSRIVNEILQVLQTTLKSGIDVVQNQFPILCEQILRYNLLSNSMGLVISLVVMIGSIFAIGIGILRHQSDGSDYMDEPSIILIIVGSVFGVVALVGAISFCFDLMKVMTAPNLVLLEAIGSMAK